MTSKATVARFLRVDEDNAPGGRIKARRESLGMSATRLAKMAEVSREHLSAVENGHKEPTTEWVRRLEIAMDQYARETGQSTDPTDQPPAEESEPLRLTFRDVYGVGEIIAEGPADKGDELVEAVAKLLAELRSKGDN